MESNVKTLADQLQATVQQLDDLDYQLMCESVFESLAFRVPNHGLFKGAYGLPVRTRN